MNELVSICTPCYNHEKYLNDYFDSIIDQDYQNIELILIDDCSKDSSREIIKKNMNRLQQRFVRVVYIENTVNKGVIRNCNILIKKANGIYIKIFASDDIMKKDCISILVDYMNSNMDKDMVYSTYEVEVNDNFHYHQNSKRNIKIRKSLPINEKEIFKRLLDRDTISGPSVLLRKESIMRLGEFDVNAVYEDYEYWVRVSAYGKIGVINKPVVYYRNAADSMTKMLHNKKKFLDFCKAEMYVFNKYKCLLDKDSADQVLFHKYQRIKFMARDNKLYQYYLLFALMELKVCILLQIKRIRD